MKSKLTNGIINGIIAFTGFFILTSMAHAQGTLLKHVTLPVLAPTGVGIETDCDGNLYYTNFSGCDSHLYKIDKNGTLLSTVNLVDSFGASVSIGAISWDSNRHMLWGGTQCSYSPNLIYLIDPATGLSKLKFAAHTAGNQLDDGIAYDPTDSSVWITPDVSQTIEHFKEDGTYLSTLTPAIPASICSTCDISGVIVGVGDLLYLGLDGKGVIVQIKKSDGSYISSFYSPGGRDEDLACDPVNFYPKLAIWSRDAYNNTIDAIEVNNGTCVCGVVPPVAGFEADKTTDCAFNCFTFTDLSTNATSWNWTFTGAADSVSTKQNPQNICYSQSGTYDVKLVVVSASGGKDSMTIHNYIHIKPVPPLPSISHSGNLLYFSADPTYIAYQWYDSTALVPGGTDTFLVVTHSGNYNVEVMNADSCKIAAGISIVLAVESFTPNPLFNIYPNPVTGELTISRSADLTDAKVTIYNMTGELVFTGMMNGKIKTIDCRSFAAGLYFIRLASEHGSWSERFMCVGQLRR